MPPSSVAQAVVLFAVYSFGGWLIEVAYRSLTQRRWVNPGFLRGPFVPLYGFGAALVVALQAPLAGLHPLPQMLAYGLVLTALEYLVGMLLERVLHLRLWDYSRDPLNLRGRVSLPFSAAWAALAYAFARLLHPHVAAAVAAADGPGLRLLADAFIIYAVLDGAASIASVRAFRDVMRRVRAESAESLAHTEAELGRVLRRLARLRRAFPALNAHVAAELAQGLRSRLDGGLREAHRRLLDAAQSRRPLEGEYKAAVADILADAEFKKLKLYHHHSSSIYAHACGVSYLSYKICKQLDLDWRSAARGGLLHDFFLYDWRHHDLPELDRRKFHGLEHPKIALNNAQARFRLNAVERDCIVKHMWPLTPLPPRHIESLVVSMADKYLASKEWIDGARRRVKPPSRRPNGKTV